MDVNAFDVSTETARVILRMKERVGVDTNTALIRWMLANAKRNDDGTYTLPTVQDS